MRSGLIDFFKRAFRSESNIHPLDRRVARRWIMQRLVVVFPELRGNQPAIEEAYRTLDIEARVESNGRTWQPVFEITVPGE